MTQTNLVNEGVSAVEVLVPGMQGEPGLAVDGNGLLEVPGTVVQSPAAVASPPANGQLLFEATDNTTITVKFRGSDGTVRSATIALA